MVAQAACHANDFTRLAEDPDVGADGAALREMPACRRVVDHHDERTIAHVALRVERAATQEAQARRLEESFAGRLVAHARVEVGGRVTSDDHHVGVLVVAAPRQVGGRASRSNSVDPQHRLANRLDARADGAGLRLGRRRYRDAEGQHARRAESVILCGEPLVLPPQLNRARAQDARQRDLDHHQRRPQSTRPPPRRHAPRGRDVTRAPGREQRGDQHRADRDGHAEHGAARRERDLVEPRKLLRQPGAEQRQGPRGEQHADQAADAAEQRRSRPGPRAGAASGSRRAHVGRLRPSVARARGPCRARRCLRRRPRARAWRPPTASSPCHGIGR